MLVGDRDVEVQAMFVNTELGVRLTTYEVNHCSLGFDTRSITVLRYAKKCNTSCGANIECECHRGTPRNQADSQVDQPDRESSAETRIRLPARSSFLFLQVMSPVARTNITARRV